ncbi:MAG: hypothetical protein AB8G77_05915, partial [Rhodothermales bacterium]
LAWMLDQLQHKVLLKCERSDWIQLNGRGLASSNAEAAAPEKEQPLLRVSKAGWKLLDSFTAIFCGINL